MEHHTGKPFIHWLSLSILMICLSPQVNCQELFSNQKSLQLSLGSIHYRFIDEFFTQKKAKFSGTAFSSQVKYEKSTSKYSLGGFIGYSQGKVKNSPSDVKVQLHDLQAAIFYQKVLSNRPILGKEGRLSAGAQISLVDYVLIDDDILENAVITFNYVFDILVSQKIAVNPKNRFSLSLALPMAGFIKREASDGGVNQQLERDFDNNPVRFFIKGSKLQFINPLSLARISLDYIFHPNRKTNFVVSYQFNYVQNRSKLPIFLYSNYLGLGLNIGLQKF